MINRKTASEEDQACFDLITEAHHLILRSVPFCRPQSYEALDDFVSALHRICAPRSVRDAVCMRVLETMSSQARHLPGLAGWYMAEPEEAASVGRFRQCAEWVLVRGAVANPLVLRALAVLEERYSEAGMGLRVVAAELGCRPSRLCVVFRASTGRTVHEYLKELRLDWAARMLEGSGLSCKEIWARVGYNYASDFAHDFKRRFKMTSREFRRLNECRTTDDKISRRERCLCRHELRCAAGVSSGTVRTVLLVDDDEFTVTTSRRYLEVSGYSVITAARGEGALNAVTGAHVDVVLLDYRLPDATGMDVLRTLRSLPLAPQPVVFMFTADIGVERDLVELHALGAEMLSKLCDMDEVVEYVGSAFPAAYQV